VRVRPYKTAGNKIEGAVLSFQDIDSLKRAVEQTRAYADTLIENAREPILVLDQDLRVLVANAAFYRMFNVSPEETENRLIYDLGTKQWKIPILYQLLEDVLSKNTRIDEFKVKHDFPGLGFRRMLLNARRIEPHPGKQLILLSFDDTTEQTVRLEALTTQSALLELAHDAVIVRDLQGTISFWNRGAEEMYGWTKAEALGKRKQELLKSKYPKPLSEIQTDLLRTGRWEGELVHTRRDGELRIVDGRWVPLKRGDENTVVLEINTDITARKSYEERLRLLSAHLMRVQDEERRRIARELHDSTGQQLAAMGMVLDELSRHLGGQRKEAETLKQIQDLLDSTNREIRTMAQLLHPPELDLAGLISATRTLVERFAERSGITVGFQAPPAMKRLADGVDLTLFRVVQECLTNIHRHSGAKHATIYLSETPEEVILEISDDGRGMPNDLLQENARDGGESFGVGILGMKERLSQLGGTLEISSKGQGTTVRAVVPKAQRKVVSA
jgi:PAS domain S-box-containing protein